jgi:DNA-binding IclR family transcriptional regulator
MKKPKGEYSIQTVVNALRLLEAFRDEDELGVTELSRRLALHKNNVFRLLATLEKEGYVEQSFDGGCYRLGVRCLELGQSFFRSRSLVQRARPTLEELAARTRESAHLAVMRDFEVVHVDGVVPDRLAMTRSRVGIRLPLHCTALGKILLGCSPERVREAYDRDVVDGGELIPRTPATIVDPHKLFEHVGAAAVRGYAIDLEECEHGLGCAAAPIFDEEGEVVAALSVSGLLFRMSSEQLLKEVVPLVTQAATRISRELGYDT